MLRAEDCAWQRRPGGQSGDVDVLLSIAASDPDPPTPGQGWFGSWSVSPHPALPPREFNPPPLGEPPSLGP